MDIVNQVEKKTHRVGREISPTIHGEKKNAIKRKINQKQSQLPWMKLYR